jgi:hypothetical protein
MSDQPGVTGAAERSAGRAIDALKPAQYLALILLNVIVLGGLLIYLDRREERRDERLTPIIAGCLGVTPK